MTETKQRVRIDPVVVVHHILEHGDHREARNGISWIQCAADRLRFKQRIANSEANMNIILDVNHRLVIYNNRFK